jgi:hypothetical protein
MNTQNTLGPLSMLCFSLPFSFPRLSLFGHMIAPAFICAKKVYPIDKNSALLPVGFFTTTKTSRQWRELLQVPSDFSP